MKKTAHKIARRSVLFLLPTAVVSTIAAHRSRGEETPTESVKIASKVSLVHLGSIDSFDITEDGIRAARLLLDALENRNLESATAARQIYSEIIPKENFGGEYTALQWFSDYLLASREEKLNFLQDKFTASFFRFFAENNFANLKEYLKRKYKLGEFQDQDSNKGQKRETFLEDFILFNNPRREEWEKTSKIIKVLNLQPGTTIADVGSGPGYYSFKFSEIVGDKGLVYAIDTVEDHLRYIGRISQKFGIDNIETVITQGDQIGLSANLIDVAFMCSLYHIIYTTSIEEVKDRFVKSIRKALRRNGKLVIVDNALVENSALPYHGPYIARELIIGQLKHYGFRLVSQHAFIPQRYVLIFQKA